MPISKLAVVLIFISNGHLQNTRKFYKLYAPNWRKNLHSKTSPEYEICLRSTFCTVSYFEAVWLYS